MCKPLVIDLLQPLPEQQVEDLDAHDRADLRLGRKQGLKTGMWAGRAVKIPGPFVRQLHDAELLAVHDIVSGDAVTEVNSAGDG